MLDWLGGALSAVGGKGKELLADPNFLKYIGGAGSLFGQGASAGQALDPSAMISGQQEQQAINQILQGSSGMAQGGGGVGVAPSGERMLPSGVPSKLGAVLGGMPAAAQEVVGPVAETVGGAVSPMIQAVPQAAGAAGGGVGDILGLVQQLAGGMGGMMGGAGAPGAAGAAGAPVSGHMLNASTPEPPMLEGRGYGGMAPTPIGTAGPDSVVTKQTADGTTTTVQTPSERNLSTFGTSVPPEAQRLKSIGTTAPIEGQMAAGNWPGYEQYQAEQAASPMKGAYQPWKDPDTMGSKAEMRRRFESPHPGRPEVFGIEYGKSGQSPGQLPLQMGVGAATGGPVGGMLPLWKALLGM